MTQATDTEKMIERVLELQKIGCDLNCNNFEAEECLGDYAPQLAHKLKIAIEALKGIATKETVFKVEWALDALERIEEMNL
jgi:hypothetical protein